MKWRSTVIFPDDEYFAMVAKEAILMNLSLHRLLGGDRTIGYVHTRHRIWRDLKERGACYEWLSKVSGFSVSGIQYGVNRACAKPPRRGRKASLSGIDHFTDLKPSVSANRLRRTQ